jgi:ribosomal protein S6--L-glutamate ligase
MRIAILSGGLGWHVCDLIRAAGERAIAAETLDFRRLWSAVDAGGEPLSGFDAVIVRTMPPGSLEQVIFRMDLLHRLHRRGVAVLNSPRSLEVCIDKYLATVQLSAAGLPVPPTVALQTADEAMEAFERLGSDIVVKPLFGSEGRGMVRVSDPDVAWRTFRAIERVQSVLYLQRFIDHPGYDVRAFVIGGRVVASMRRHAREGWRTNVAQGGRAEAIRLSQPEHDLALKAAAAVGASVCGVDLLPGPDDARYVLEVNAVPGWRALAPTCGIDVAAAIVDFLVADRTSTTCR